MKPRWIGVPLPARYFMPVPPASAPPPPTQPIVLTPDEVEAIRLVDLKGLNQEEAGAYMGVSRGTIWRILKNARIKLAKAIIEGRPIIISPQQIPQKTSGKETET